MAPTNKLINVRISGLKYLLALCLKEEMPLQTVTIALLGDRLLTCRNVDKAKNILAVITMGQQV